MPHPTPEDLLGALRDEIRRAGRHIFWIRWSLVGSLTFLPAALLLLRLRFQRAFRYDDLAWGLPLRSLLEMLGGPAAACVLTATVAFLIAIAICRIRGHQLRPLVATLDRSAAAELLIPLAHGPGDSRKLARSLLRDLGLPTELMPAGRPEGNSAEMSGAPDTRTEASGCKEGRVPGQDVFERVKDVILRVFGGRPARVTRSAPLNKEFDSIFLEDVLLVEALEQEFGIPLPNEATEGMSTVGDMVAYIQSQLGKASEPSPTPTPISCGDEPTPAP